MSMVEAIIFIKVTMIKINDLNFNIIEWVLIQDGSLIGTGAYLIF